MNFKNLAGRNRPMEENDKQICIELKRCSLDVAPWDCGTSEVRTNNCGVLGPSRFHRAWTYWTFSGRVPLEMAKRIYRHPVGYSDIRVGGHSGCPAPEGNYVEWRDPETGRRYARVMDRENMERFAENHPDMVTKFMNEYLFHDDPESIGAIGTVDSYHIDTELGLYVFVQFLRGQL